MRGHYGKRRRLRVSARPQSVAMTAGGWIGFHKDTQYPAQHRRADGARHGAGFILCAAGDILAEQVAARYCVPCDVPVPHDSGPFIYTVHPSKIVRVLQSFIAPINRRRAVDDLHGLDDDVA